MTGFLRHGPAVLAPQRSDQSSHRGQCRLTRLRPAEPVHEPPVHRVQFTRPQPDISKTPTGLVRRGHLKPGDTVLVHGAAGGVGTAAVQLGSALGARVIAVVSGPDKFDTARGAGSDEVVPAGDFEEAVRKLTGDRGVDLVVDPVGGDRLAGSLNSLAREGRSLVVGAAGGDVPQVRVDSLMRKNLDVAGIGWGAFWAERPSFLKEQWAELLPLLQAGKLSPVLGRRFPLAQASQALLELDQRRARGKVLLDVR